MIWNNWACYTKINTIPLFNVFSQQIFIPLVKNSGEVAQIFCLIMLGGEILYALNLVQCVDSICTVRLELRMRHKESKWQGFICISLSLTLAAATCGCTTADPALSWPRAEPAHAGRAWAGKEVLNRHQISSSRKL